MSEEKCEHLNKNKEEMSTCLEMLSSIFYLLSVANLLLILGCQLL